MGRSQAELPAVCPRLKTPSVVPRWAPRRVPACELGFFGDLAGLAELSVFGERVRALRNSPFVVYAKPPFGGPERVLAYLARTTHRTAIGNSSLVAVTEAEVAFRYKNYRRGGRSGIMRLAPHEFIRRSLLHVLPDGFHRIRHSGFLAKADRGEKLARVRELLHVASKRQEKADPEKADPKKALCGDPQSRRRSRRLHALPGLRGLHAPH